MKTRNPFRARPRVEQLETRLALSGFSRFAYDHTTFGTSYHMGDVGSKPLSSDDITGFSGSGPGDLYWGDVRMFEFTVNDGQNVDLTLQEFVFDYDLNHYVSADIGAYLRLFSSDGTELDANAGSLTHKFQGDGTYYAGVSFDFNTSYDPITGANTNYQDRQGRFTLTLAGAKPADLIMLDASLVEGAGGPQTPRVDESFQVDFQWRSKTASFTGTFKAGLYFSADKAWDASDEIVQELTITVPGDTQHHINSFVVVGEIAYPEDKPYFLVMLDKDLAVTEKNEANNDGLVGIACPKVQVKLKQLNSGGVVAQIIGTKYEDNVLVDDQQVVATTTCGTVRVTIHKNISSASLIYFTGKGGSNTFIAVPTMIIPMVLTGGPDVDHLSGGAADDTIFGGGGRDYLHGNDGDDFLYGDAGDDELFGGLGADYLNGGADDDELYAFATDFGNNPDPNEVAADTLFGSSGDDVIYGNNGNNVLIGGKNDFDIIRGFDGADMFSSLDMKDGDNKEIQDFVEGVDQWGKQSSKPS